MIAERGDFPADTGKVREFVLKAIGLKIGQSEPLGEKDRARLNLDASGTKVEFKAADGKNSAPSPSGASTSSARSTIRRKRSRTGASSGCRAKRAPPTWWAIR